MKGKQRQVTNQQSSRVGETKRNEPPPGVCANQALVLALLLLALAATQLCSVGASSSSGAFIVRGRGRASIGSGGDEAGRLSIQVEKRDRAPIILTMSADQADEPNWRVCRSDALSGGSDGPASPSAPWTESAYDDALALHDRLSACTDSYVAPLIRDALHILEQAYRLHGLNSVVGSYNGGKDAVVILHLMRAAHAKFHHDKLEAAARDGGNGQQQQQQQQQPLPAALPPRPRVVYFMHANEFPEVIDLLHDTVARFDLDMVAFEEGIQFSDGLKLLVDTNYPTISSTGTIPPYPMAFVLGTRTSDPNAGSQGKFAPSSHWMPPFMRVNPVLEWTYGHVWHFLRLFQLPYCSLYDRGFTSLGTTRDTLPCPALAKPTNVGGNEGDESGSTKYWPAFMLRDWDQERAGRIDKKKKMVVHTISESSSTASLSSKAEPATKEQAGDVDDHSAASSESCEAQKTVGLLIIGDEILKGLTPDTNTHAAASALREHNVPLARVSVVSDDRDEISSEIRRMQEMVDVIITSGGVGPTHDDVTMKSVAAALGDELVLHEGMANFLLEKMDGSGSDDGSRPELTVAQIKMGTLPSCSKLRYLTKDAEEWPVLQCRNIFILPGVPQFFEKKVEALAAHLSTELERSMTYKVVLSIDETSIVTCLNDVVRRHPGVSFGSYPFVDHPEYKTVVTLEGRLIEGGYTRNSGRFLNRTRSASGGGSSTMPGEDGSSTRTIPPPPHLLYTKEEMDLNVKLALTDLLSGMPEGSVLRVENNDDLSIS